MNRKNIEAIYPLSPSQQGMLFETLSALDSGIHIEQSLGSLYGNLNLKAFELAWQHIVERHSILRTAFVWENQNEPLQVVLRQVKVPLTKENWSSFSPSVQQEKLENYLKDDRSLGFQLNKSPLMRLALFELGENKYKLAWSHHHILMDGWCQPLILKEFFTLYRDFCQGEYPSLPPTRPYRDYIAWYRQQDLSVAKTFWQKTLEGFKSPNLIVMKALESNSVSNNNHYGEARVSLEASTTSKLQSLAKQYRLTLNTLIQGVWALLLSRYSGDSDVVFGATVSSRPPELPDIESTIGLFVNTIPIRFEICEEASFWSWLQDIQIKQIEQKTYQYCSAGQIHQWSDVPSSLPLYQSILVFENYPSDSSTLDSSELTLDIGNSLSIGAQTNYPLTFLIVPGSELKFHVVYNGNYFAHSDIQHLLQDFLNLFNSIITNPELKLADTIPQISATLIEKINSVKKLSRQDLKDSFVPPRDPLERQLAKIWEELLGFRPVGVQDRFFELGGHSLLALSLMAQIQEKFGKNLPLATLFQKPSIEQLANALREETDSLARSVAVPIQSNGSKPPFFCVPGGGGNIIYLYQLAHSLGSDRPFYGLEAIGLDGQSKPPNRIEDIAAYYIETIQKIQPQGPYFLGGHSLGSWIAFEMAQQLRQSKHEVALVVVIDTPAPVERELILDSEWDDTTWIFKIADLAERLFGKSLALSYESLQNLTPEEQFKYLSERLTKVNFLPPGAENTQVNCLLKVFKANYQARNVYLPKQIYPQNITLLRAEELNLKDAEFDTEIYKETTWGWDRITSGSVEVDYIPGDHITMMTKPYVQILSEKLKASLEKAQRNSEKI